MLSYFNIIVQMFTSAQACNIIIIEDIAHLYIIPQCSSNRKWS